MAPTPNRKRKSASAAITPKSNAGGSANVSANSTPAKKRASRGKGKSDTVINLDVDDPFSFDSKSDTHPEPLKNISVERTAFGGMKFSRSPPSSSERYASLEKIAERRGNVSGLSSSATRPSPLSVTAVLQSSSSVSTTPKTKGKKRVLLNQSSSEYQMDEDEDKDFANESIKGKSTPGTPAAPGSAQSSAKRRSKSSAFTEAAASIYEQKKTNEEDLYKVPELNPIEQLEVDHATEEHKLLAPGARVLALWGHEFYAAYVCGRDGLSRYLVHFVEDNLNRLLPPTGVIPLALLSTGYEISFIWPVDDEEVGKVGEIVAAPSGDDAEEWVEGIFEVREANLEQEEVKKVSWEKIYLSKEQRAKINVSAVNSTVFVDQENIVNESRSSRRSRTTRFSNESLATGTVSTPQPASASRATRSAKTPKTPKTPAVEVPVEEEESVEAAASSETLPKIPTQTPKTEGNRRGQSGGRKPSPVKPVTPASTRSTPRRKATQQKQVEEEVQREEDEKEEDVNMEEKQPQEEEKQPTIQPSSQQPEEIQPVEQQQPEVEEPTAAETTAKEISMEEQSTPPVEEPEEQPQEEQQAEIMEVAADTVEQDKNNQSTHEVPEVNSNGTGAEAAELSFNIEQLNGTVEEGQADEKDTSAATAIHNLSNGSSPTKQQQTDNNMTAMEFLAANDEEAVPSSTEQPATPDAVAAKPVNTTMFENMKFVLTSATRSKKTSDFNKRDYRTKIEERGGQMIEDFSALQEGDKAFLIADTYYRTHKYLSALSLSVPCVKHNWILECVNQEHLVDHLPFMLPAGESTLDSTKIYDWKPLKGQLLREKRVWLGFVDIWSSIISNLGAELVEGMPQGIMDKLERCRENPVNILLSDVTCEKALAERVEAEGGIAVSSEWVIQAIVTGELPDVNASDRFRFDSAP
uniref:BRCT domain-containing protein n=1 Tax=Ditylenchus dipsaci TaxID=166011 RepID=A0A915DD71_9BILA